MSRTLAVSYLEHLERNVYNAHRDGKGSNPRSSDVMAVVRICSAENDCLEDECSHIEKCTRLYDKLV